MTFAPAEIPAKIPFLRRQSPCQLERLIVRDRLDVVDAVGVPVRHRSR